MILILLLGFRFRLSEKKKSYIVLAGIYMTYLLLQALALSVFDLSLVFTELFILVGVLISLYTKDETWHYALYAIVYPVLFFALSYFVTILITLLTGYSIIDLTYFAFHIFQPRVIEDFYKINIVFPFSPMMGLGNANIANIDFGRAIGYMREPGIYQILVVISFFGLDYISIKYRKIFKTLVFLSLLITFSTTGMVVFILSYFYYYYISGDRKFKMNFFYKAISFLIISLGSYFFVFTNEKFGLLAKLTYESGLQRLQHYQESIQIFLDNPIIGVGLFNSSVPGSSIFAILASLGIVGAGLFFLMVILPIWHLIKRRDRLLVFLIPVLVTAFFSQPLSNMAIFFVILSLVISYPTKYKSF
ncbi:O-antigen ligase family protein [Fodinibius sp. Rm-B-1B1-1]|uniref:O-antigen ligase family protein n=1 Tax=Fodinibius alkaliphilus TaxID=3140241 RepID=UPI00315B275A